jgi:TolB protein
MAPSQTPTEEPTAEPTPIGGGGLIAFVSNRLDARYFQVFTMRPDGSDLTQITFDSVTKRSPVWSPDGTKILYVADGGTKYGTKLELDVWLLDLSNGSAPLNLTESPGHDYDPYWSPDGSKIIFVSERILQTPQLFIMNSDGSDPKNITVGYAVETGPIWSPDGMWIALESSINASEPKFWLRSGSGIDPRAFDISDSLGWVEDLDWSPDGELIAYTSVQEGRNEIKVAVFADKGKSIYVLTDTLGNKHPSWSPDSQWLALTSTRDLNPEIYTMDRTGRLQTNITNNPAKDQEPDWQPIQP